VFLEGCGIAELGGADGASVLAFLASLLGRWAKSSLFWVVSNFRPFLKFTGRSDLVDALNLAGIKRSHAIIPVLGDADEELVVEACASGAVSARDAAITLLALTTGLRACDIVGMRTGDIDWRSRTIGIVQQKTGNPLTLPLPALVMAKLADYVLGERPCSGDDHLFLRSVAPHTRLNDHASVHRVTVTTFQKAGVAKEGRDPAAAPQRRVAASGRGGAPADNLGRARPRQRGIDEPVYERRPAASARMCTAGC
jgi:integrase